MKTEEMARREDYAAKQVLDDARDAIAKVIECDPVFCRFSLDESLMLSKVLQALGQKSRHIVAVWD